MFSLKCLTKKFNRQTLSEVKVSWLRLVRCVPVKILYVVSGKLVIPLICCLSTIAGSWGVLFLLSFSPGCPFQLFQLPRENCHIVYMYVFNSERVLHTGRDSNRKLAVARVIYPMEVHV